jgi:HD superfamily phosphohydrolase
LAKFGPSSFHEAYSRKSSDSEDEANNLQNQEILETLEGVDDQKAARFDDLNQSDIHNDEISDSCTEIKSMEFTVLNPVHEQVDGNLNSSSEIEARIFQKPPLVFKNSVFFMGHQLLDVITQQSQMELSSSKSIVVKNFQETETKAWAVSIGQAVKQETKVPKLHHSLILVIVRSKSKTAYPVTSSCWRLKNGVLDIIAVLRRHFAVLKILQHIVFGLWHQWRWKARRKLIYPSSTHCWRDFRIARA